MLEREIERAAARLDVARERGVRPRGTIEGVIVGVLLAIATSAVLVYLALGAILRHD